MKKNLFYFLVFVILWLSPFSSKAQTISMDQTPMEEAIRRLQLMGKIDANYSFHSRPIQAPQIHAWDTALQSLDPRFYKKGIKKIGAHFLGKFGYISLQPISIDQQYVSQQPFRELDGPMIASSGYQIMASAGVYVKLGPLSIQYQPQYVKANNLSYLDMIESPNFEKTYWGNSSIRLNLGAASVGISTENITWGPSVMNPLIMSAHAPGFAHATFNSKRPLKTPIGYFEWQLIAGYPDTLAQQYFKTADFPNAAMPGKRYFNGAMISYQPKWTKGLSFGILRTVQENETELQKYNKYFLLFNNVARINDTSFEQEQERDQYAALFVRWLWQPANAEIYAEWGRNDTYYTMRDFIQQPEHSRAYTFGLRKLLNNWQLMTEYTRIQQPPTWPVRTAYSWYEHSRVMQGHSNEGQYLGAPIGLGSNYGMIRVSKFKGWQQIGLQLESTTQQADQFEDGDLAITNPSLHKWVDYGCRIFMDYPFQNFLISATLAYKRSFNYNFSQPLNASGLGIANPNDVDSYLIKLTIRYR